MESPFKFLDSYDKEDSDQFFGRSKEVAQLYNAVHASNLIMVYGASGTGKTSLVKCGLANQFHDTDWKPLFINRGKDLNESLDDSLNQAYPENQWTAETPLRHRVKELYLEYYRPIYLIFDQFEELYILGKEAEQKSFHRSIATLLQASLPCKILLVIREEYIAYLSELEKVVPPLFDNRLRIEKMNEGNLIRAITGTLKHWQIQLEEPKVTIDAILKNLKNNREGIALTNLQVYLDRLWRTDRARQEEKNRTQIIFDLKLVKKVGPMQDVLSDFLDEQLLAVENGLRRMGVAQPQGVPLEILYTMVTDEATKRNLAFAAIQEDIPKNRKLTPSQLQYCLKEFERLRLLRYYPD